MRCIQGQIFLLIFLLVLGESAALEKSSTLKAVLVTNEYVSKSDIDKADGILCRGINPKVRRPIQKALKPYLGETVSKELIEDIRSTALRVYDENNYPMVLISVPPQTIMDGKLVLIAKEASVGKVTYEGNSWTKTSTLEGMMALESGDPLNQQLLINNIEFLNKNPFRTVRAAYRPGTLSTTTDVTLYVEEKRPYRFYTGVNNNGLPDTQLARFYAGLTWGNCFSLGHVFSGQFTTSPNFKNLLSGNGAYMIPLPNRHLLSFFGGYATTYSSSIPSVLENSGYSWQVSTRYTIPLNTSAHYAHEVLVGIDFKRMNNNILFTSTFPQVGSLVTISEVVLSYFGSYSRGFYSVNFDGSAYYSPGDLFSGQSKSEYKTLNPFACPDFLYARFSLSNTLRFPFDYLMKINFKGQGSTTTLLSSETLGIGGESSVRGYYERELNGDNGLIASGEIYSPKTEVFTRNKDDTDELRFLGFVDFGQRYNWKSVGGEDLYDCLLGMGLGLRYHWSTFIKATFDYGFKIADTISDSGLGRPYVTFQLSY